jgi:copper chaperone CopZ
MKQNKVIRIGGMHCVRCSAAVENALRYLANFLKTAR